ncbi:MAG: ABC transporter permease, partial [Eggerthellaceae bacterium]|nr:ABC transporter permease [Eggerthellaceae bacterium]
LIFLILFGSVSFIYNSFSISVGERKRLFGIMKSIGATNGQIRSSVFTEAAVLAGIGIPIGLIVGCLGMGITLHFIGEDLAVLFAGLTEVKLSLAVSPTILLISALICFVTTILSAWIPAIRVSRVSPMDAVRQTQDIKIRQKDVKTSKLTQRLFGFEGVMASKNFKRNKKRNRSVVFSLVLSVTLFVSAASFSTYLTQAINDIANAQDTGADIVYTAPYEDINHEEMLRRLMEAGNCDDGSYYGGSYYNVDFEADSLDKAYLDDLIGRGYPEIKENNRIGEMIRIVFLSDAAFDALCRQNNIAPELFRIADSPRALAYNRNVERVFDENMNMSWRTYNIFNPSALPTTVYMDSYIYPNPYENDYYRTGETVLKDGVEYFVAYTYEYMFGLWEQGNPDIKPDPAYSVLIRRDEIIKTTPIEVVRTISEPPFGFSNKRSALFVPFGMADIVTGSLYSVDYVFKAADHAKARDAMAAELDEMGLDGDGLYDIAGQYEMMRMLINVVNVFAYGFIILISLIAIANVFNTISTNIGLRRREIAMLKSVGMGQKSFKRMMSYECIIYGLKGLLIGLPLAFLITYGIFRIVADSVAGTAFFIPIVPVIVAMLSVFAVVFVSMLYATAKIKKDNSADMLRNENI